MSATRRSVAAVIRRNALAALSLHAGLERDLRAAVPDIGDLALRVSSSLLTLATATLDQSELRLRITRGASLVRLASRT